MFFLPIFWADSQRYGELFSILQARGKCIWRIDNDRGDSPNLLNMICGCGCLERNINHFPYSAYSRKIPGKLDNVKE